MAEWSKALYLGRSIFGCVGSNTTPVTFFYKLTGDRYQQEMIKKVKMETILEHTKTKNLSRTVSKRQDGQVV